MPHNARCLSSNVLQLFGGLYGKGAKSRKPSARSPQAERAGRVVSREPAPMARMEAQMSLVCSPILIGYVTLLLLLLLLLHKKKDIVYVNGFRGWCLRCNKKTGGTTTTLRKNQKTKNCNYIKNQNIDHTTSILNRGKNESIFWNQ